MVVVVEVEHAVKEGKRDEGDRMGKCDVQRLRRYIHGY
jgi:hypothetical protein